MNTPASRRALPAIALCLLLACAAACLCGQARALASETDPAAGTAAEPDSALTAQDIVSYAITYDYDSTARTASVTGFTGTASGKLSIPGTVMKDGVDYTVTAISDAAFDFGDRKGEAGFTSLSLPSTITSIGKTAFRGCENLTGDNPDGMGGLTLPENLTTIGERAFADCTSLTGRLVLRDGLLAIGEGAFASCDYFEPNLTIPASVETIGEEAFYEFGTFSETTSTSNQLVFAGAEDGSSALKVIGEKAFWNAKGFVGRLAIPDSVETIGKYAFSGGIGFTELKLPENSEYTTIAECTFGVLNSYTDIMGFNSTLTIPANIETIEKGAFGNCQSVEALQFAEGSKLAIIGQQAFWRCFALESATFPSGLKAIGQEAFRDCTLLSSLTIPDSVETIGDGAFMLCATKAAAPGELVLGSGVQTIGADAFKGVKFTGKLPLPKNIESIGDEAFKDCTGFTGTLDFPSNVSSVGVSAFEGCTGLTGTLSLPGGISSIGVSAFKDCTGFTGTLLVPSTVTSIGSGAFKGCTGLESVDLQSTAMLPDSLFEGCTGLTGDVTIPAGTTTMGKNVFAGCIGLTGTLSIPSSVTTVDTGHSLYRTAFSQIKNEGTGTFSVHDMLFPRGGFFVDQDDNAVFDDGVLTTATYTYAVPTGLADATVEGITDKEYTGADITQDALAVKAGGATLVEGEDYLVSYADNRETGNNSAKISITGINRYGDQIVRTFSIKHANPLTVSTAKATVSTTYNPSGTRTTANNVKAKGAQGTVAYANASTDATAEKFTVDAQKGKVIIPKATKVGTYLVIVKATAAGNANYFAASKTASYKISVAKAANPMVVKATAKRIKLAKVTRKKQTVTPLKATKAQGRKTFKVAKWTTKKARKYFTLNTKTGKVTAKKGTPKGTYKIKVKVTAAGTSNYKAKTKTLTVTLRVK